VRIIYDKETGKSKGFGYVQFENPNSLQTAIQLNASELDGRNIKVDNANK
jgi:RNA recognition motif-containing protein